MGGRSLATYFAMAGFIATSCHSWCFRRRKRLRKQSSTSSSGKNPMGVRKNQRNLSKAERKRYVEAVLEMKDKTAAAYNYDKYVTMHDAAFTPDPDTNPAH